MTTKYTVLWHDRPIVDKKPTLYQLDFVARDTALAFATSRLIKNSDLTIDESSRVYSSHDEIRFCLILMPDEMRRCRMVWVAGLLTGPNDHRPNGARCIHNIGHEGDHRFVGDPP